MGALQLGAENFELGTCYCFTSYTIPITDGIILSLRPRVDVRTSLYESISLRHCQVLISGTKLGGHSQGHQWRSQDFYQGGAQLERNLVIVRGEAMHGQLGWP